MKNIAVLMGGLSNEREVSLSSGKEVLKALKQLGYNGIEVIVDEDIADKLSELEIDIAFNALHGTYGEDGCIQGLLEILKIPYTHSGVLASAIAMDKDITRQLVADIVNVPFGGLLGDVEVELPFVIKPVSDGSSVDIHLIQSMHDLPELKNKKYLIEQYIPGKELSVAVTDDGSLGVIEIIADGFYDYRNKYTSNVAKHIMPANIDTEFYNLAMEKAYLVHKRLGCRSISRVDFRFDGKKLYFLEINTHPGLTELSLFPEIANYKGIGFKEIIKKLLGDARCEN